jgi:flavin reductase (DIM6/NTAB) family NADH-FMN oxidoreductase RutF
MDSPLPLVPSADFVQAMGQHAAAVCVITTAHEGARYGLTATAVSSVCASPPRLLVCVNKLGMTHQTMAAASSFCVNVLAEEQEQVAKGFAGMFGKDFEKFSVGQWGTLVTGAPALASATAVFDCKVAQQIDQFSHSIFIGEVVGITCAPGRDALIYGARRFRTLRKTMQPALTEAEEMLHF